MMRPVYCIWRPKTPGFCAMIWPNVAAVGLSTGLSPLNEFRRLYASMRSSNFTRSLIGNILARVVSRLTKRGPSEIAVLDRIGAPGEGRQHMHLSGVEPAAAGRIGYRRIPVHQDGSQSQRHAGIISEQAAYRPPAENGIQHRVDGVHEMSSAAEGEFVNGGAGESLARILRRNPGKRSREGIDVVVELLAGFVVVVIP